MTFEWYKYMSNASVVTGCSRCWGIVGEMRRLRVVENEESGRHLPRLYWLSVGKRLLVMFGLVVWLVVCGCEWVCAYEVVAGFSRAAWGVWVLAAVGLVAGVWVECSWVCFWVCVCLVTACC